MISYLGVDLAWGERARTGLAALDAEGRLVASASVKTDAEIASFVGVHASDSVVAAVDAPLIVTNPTGQRPCEAQVGRLFGRYNASAHSANLSNPAFNPQPRGARLAQAFGWDIDPATRAGEGRVCIEVYPHPAMVVLFALESVIPYKSKTGRDLDALRTAHELLLTHLEATTVDTLRLTASQRWQEIRYQVARARTKAALGVIEDEVVRSSARTSPGCGPTTLASSCCSVTCSRGTS
ncbi:MAG: hypothetical protein NVS3B26_26560 [Mycobacteriales bacterium]